MKRLLFLKQQDQLILDYKSSQKYRPGAPFSIVRCITALIACCEPALSHRINAEDDYLCLIFQHRFEPQV